MLKLILPCIFFISSLVLCVSAQGTKTQTQIRYLSGTGKDDTVLWDFFCTGGRNSGVWTKIAVPSCWEQQGFGGYNYGRDPISETNPLANEQGKYRLRFDVPADWKNKTVRIVFDGVMTDAEVFINGQSAGDIHQGAFYRFKYDITPLLKFGESNLLEVTVSKVSTNESVNQAERFGSDYWVFGGIFRPVYLEILPDAFIDRTAIDALADGSFSVDVYLGGNTSEHISAQIVDAKGAKIGKPFGAEIALGQDVVRLQTKVSGMKLWTAETPNLYSVLLTLSDEKAKPVHHITERFGFRTFEVRVGDGLYLNGQRIILKGANRHSFLPETGRTTSRQTSYDDVRLIKEANMNAVRMSHYPPDEHFLEACDELGLYVLDELGGWQRSYDTPTGKRLIGEMIRRDVNHPSILFWDNGNEGGWNRENDDEFAKWDPQKRPVLHPWELFRGVNTDHYEKYDSHTKLSSGQDIYMPTEFLHGLYDGGGGAGLWDYWELIRNSKTGGGGFLWALVDECVVRTDKNGMLDCAGNQGADGIVGPRREKEGSFYTVREIWSPVRVVAPKMLEKDFRGIFKIENLYDFTNLSECGFEWRLARFPSPFDVKSGHTIINGGTLKGTNISPHNTGELKINLPTNWREADVLYLTAKDPKGNKLWTWSWSLNRRVFAKEAKSNKTIQTRDENGTLIVETEKAELRFNKEAGMLAEVLSNGKKISFGNGPRFLAFRHDNRKFKNVANVSRLTRFSSGKEDENVFIETSHEGMLNRTRWLISPGGEVRLEYFYEFNGETDMLGVQFDLPEKLVTYIRWQGMGPYRVWQNRLHGNYLNVWGNNYNDTMPGESWAYPEFKGYFREWEWTVFYTTEGKITVINEDANSYLGVYKPKDGKAGVLDLPETGIAFLDVIPSIPNKFHTTDEIGPQSKPKNITGVKHKTLRFYFGD